MVRSLADRTFQLREARQGVRLGAVRAFAREGEGAGVEVRVDLRAAPEARVALVVVRVPRLQHADTLGIAVARASGTEETWARKKESGRSRSN